MTWKNVDFKIISNFFQRENSACREEFLVNKVWWKILSWAFSNPERERERGKQGGIMCYIYYK